MQDLNLLIALDALLETRSVTLAAQQLHLSVPAMSRTLGRIRQALSDPILVRAGAAMVPTPVAVAMQPEVRRVVADAIALMSPQFFGNDSLSTTRRFTVRGPDDVAMLVGPALLTRTTAQKGTVVHFAPEGDESVEDLRHGRVDLDIGMQHDVPPDIEVETIATTQMVGVVRDGHPIARARNVTTQQFVRYPHITVSRRGHAKGPIDQALSKTAHSRIVAAIVASSAAALAIAAKSDLIAVVPALSVPRDAPVVLFSLPVESRAFPLHMAWHRRYNHDGAHRWLRTNITEVINDAVRHLA